MKFKADEIASVIQQEIEHYQWQIDVREVGRVLDDRQARGLRHRFVRVVEERAIDLLVDLETVFQKVLIPAAVSLEQDGGAEHDPRVHERIRAQILQHRLELRIVGAVGERDAYRFLHETACRESAGARRAAIWCPVDSK